MDVTRPKIFCCITPCNGGLVLRDGEQGDVFKVGRLAMNVILLVKAIRIK